MDVIKSISTNKLFLQVAYVCIFVSVKKVGFYAIFFALGRTSYPKFKWLEHILKLWWTFKNVHVTGYSP